MEYPFHAVIVIRLSQQCTIWVGTQDNTISSPSYHPPNAYDRKGNDTINIFVLYLGMIMLRITRMIKKSNDGDGDKCICVTSVGDKQQHMSGKALTTTKDIFLLLKI